MTITITAREPLSWPASDEPDRRRQQEQAEYQLVDASHELRTPLTALRTEVELALTGNRDASELRAALRSAAEEIRRVCRLADDILMLAGADHGRLPCRPRPALPRALLEAAAGRACAAARARGRQIVVRDMAPDRWLLVDPDRAAQALDNLVSNALQYGSGTITLTARDDGELLGLHVTDQGPGFACDIAERAFQRFTRGKGVRDPGSGLGLSLVAAIASAHRGAATVCNLREGGADVSIALPRWLPETPSAQRAMRRGDWRTVGRTRQPTPTSPAQPWPTWSASPPLGTGPRRVTFCHAAAREASGPVRLGDLRLLERRAGPLAVRHPGPCPWACELPANRAGKCRTQCVMPGAYVELADRRAVNEIRQ
jgi:anti-sigma regulatory factor (Ser/Thr protein kinase)